MPASKNGAWKRTFLKALRDTGNIRVAAQAAGVHRSAPYAARIKSQRFRAEWDKALEEAVELLEAEARRRAIAGSDVLLIFLLKAHKPSMYRETIRQELLGGGGGPLAQVVLIQTSEGNIPLGDWRRQLLESATGNGHGMTSEPLGP